MVTFIHKMLWITTQSGSQLTGVGKKNSKKEKLQLIAQKKDPSPS